MTLIRPSDLPCLLALFVSFLFAIAFIFYIGSNAHMRKMMLSEAKVTILFTIGFLISNNLFWLSNTIRHHPLSQNTKYQNIYCIFWILTRGMGVIGAQYFSQLFFLYRIKVILSGLTSSMYAQIFHKFLQLFISMP